MKEFRSRPRPWLADSLCRFLRGGVDISVHIICERNAAEAGAEHADQQQRQQHAGYKYPTPYPFLFASRQFGFLLTGGDGRRRVFFQSDAGGVRFVPSIRWYLYHTARQIPNKFYIRSQNILQIYGILKSKSTFSKDVFL